MHYSFLYFVTLGSPFIFSLHILTLMSRSTFLLPPLCFSSPFFSFSFHFRSYFLPPLTYPLFILSYFFHSLFSLQVAVMISLSIFSSQFFTQNFLFSYLFSLHYHPTFLFLFFSLDSHSSPPFSHFTFDSLICKKQQNHGMDNFPSRSCYQQTKNRIRTQTPFTAVFHSLPYIIMVLSSMHPNIA